MRINGGEGCSLAVSWIHLLKILGGLNPLPLIIMVQSAGRMVQLSTTATSTDTKHVTGATSCHCSGYCHTAGRTDGGKCLCLAFLKWRRWSKVSKDSSNKSDLAEVKSVLHHAKHFPALSLLICLLLWCQQARHFYQAFFLTFFLQFSIISCQTPSQWKSLCNTNLVVFICLLMFFTTWNCGKTITYHHQVQQIDTDLRK